MGLGESVARIRRRFFRGRVRAPPNPAAHYFMEKITHSFAPQGFVTILLLRHSKKDGQIPSFLLWRRRRDSNPRSACDAYTISSRAPSTRLGDSSVSMKSRGRQCRAARYSRVGWQLDEAENKTALSNCRYRAFPRKPNDKIIAQAPPFDKPFDRKWKGEFCARHPPFPRSFKSGR